MVAYKLVRRQIIGDFFLKSLKYCTGSELYSFSICFYSLFFYIRLCESEIVLTFLRIRLSLTVIGTLFFISFQEENYIFCFKGSKHCI